MKARCRIRRCRVRKTDPSVALLGGKTPRKAFGHMVFVSTSQKSIFKYSARSPIRVVFVGGSPEIIWRRIVDVTGVSDNAGDVKFFLSVLTRALRRARHFRLVE